MHAKHSHKSSQHFSPPLQSSKQEQIEHELQQLSKQNSINKNRNIIKHIHNLKKYLKINTSTTNTSTNTTTTSVINIKIRKS